MKKFLAYFSLLVSRFTDKSLHSLCVFDDLCLHIGAIIEIQEIRLQSHKKLDKGWFLDNSRFDFIYSILIQLVYFDLKINVL